MAVMRLVDTATGVARPLRPRAAGRVTIYVCGATVHGPPHLGHLRSAVTFDLLRRWLEHGGLEVLLVRNVTDVDDIILTKAREAGRPWWEWAATHERAFTAAYEAIGCRPCDHDQPRHRRRGQASSGGPPGPRAGAAD